MENQKCQLQLTLEMGCRRMKILQNVCNMRSPDVQGDRRQDLPIRKGLINLIEVIEVAALLKVAEVEVLNIILLQ